MRLLAVLVLIAAAEAGYANPDGTTYGENFEEVGSSHEDVYVPTCATDPKFPVCTKPEIFDAATCDEFIAACEEDGGFDFGFDSLDGKPAVQIDIVENHVVRFPHLYNILEPHLENLKEFASEHFDVSFIYWIFFRRYSADGNHGRKAVRVHSDSSGATSVIVLNSGFEGGEYSVKFGQEKFNPTMNKGQRTATNERTAVTTTTARALPRKSKSVCVSSCSS